MLTEQNEIVEKVVQRYGSSIGFLIPILQDIQKEFGYLPLSEMKCVARRLGVPMSRIYAVATFYKSFSLKPRGRHLITACTGTVCHLKGAGRLAQTICAQLGIPVGGTTEDMRFTFETVNCLGACALAPILVVDGNYYAKVKQSELEKILKSYK